MKRKRTSKRIEASDLIRRKVSRIGEEVLEANGLGIPTIVEKLVEELKCCQHIVLLQQKVNDTIAQRGPFDVHGSCFGELVTYYLSSSRTIVSAPTPSSSRRNSIEGERKKQQRALLDLTSPL